MGRDADLAAVEAQSVAVADQAKAWIREAQRRKASRDRGRGAGDQKPSSREASRVARLKAMRLAWEHRGRPWDEREARAMLAEVEQRGEVRAYGPDGSMLR